MRVVLFVVMAIVSLVIGEGEPPVRAVTRARAYIALGLTDELPFNHRETVLRFACDYPQAELEALAKEFPNARITSAYDALAQKNAEHQRFLKLNAERQRHEEESTQLRLALIAKYKDKCSLDIHEECRFVSLVSNGTYRRICTGEDTTEDCEVIRLAVERCDFCQDKLDFSLIMDMAYAVACRECVYTCENTDNLETVVRI